MAMMLVIQIAAGVVLAVIALVFLAAYIQDQS
jgi:hypothetical protein